MVVSSVSTVRRMDFPFEQDSVPAHWFGGDRVLTRSSDALHLLLRENDSLCAVFGIFPGDWRRPSSRSGPSLCRAEAMHGRRQRSFALLRRDGLEHASFLGSLTFLVRMEDRASPMFNLVTCALEHLTATLGAHSFSDPMMDDAHPTMRALMLWHSAESRAQVRCVRRLQGCGGGYWMRVVAMVFAYGFLMTWWRRGMVHLLEQDSGFSMSEVRAFRRRPCSRVQRSAARRAMVSYHAVLSSG